jgi:hypothetical protein
MVVSYISFKLSALDKSTYLAYEIQAQLELLPSYGLYVKTSRLRTWYSVSELVNLTSPSKSIRNSKAYHLSVQVNQRNLPFANL